MTAATQDRTFNYRVIVQRGCFDILHPRNESIEIHITFEVDDDKRVARVSLPIDRGEQFYPWRDAKGSPVSLLRDAAEIAKEIYWYSSDKDEAVKILAWAEEFEEDFDCVSLRRERDALVKKRDEAIERIASIDKTLAFVDSEREERS